MLLEIKCLLFRLSDLQSICDIGRWGIGKLASFA